MNRLPHCRLLLEPDPQSGARNMAIDEVLLNSAVQRGVATFRWYRWAEPTLSLGYFQTIADIDAESRWSRLPRVRRLTGGGAILHDRDWTYSIALPAHPRLVERAEDLYDLVHGALAELLRSRGCPAELRGPTPPRLPEPVLCFSRRDAHDVVVQGHKIIGSAQRRRKGAVLQHGSLLIRQSALNPEHLGIEDFSGRNIVGIGDLARIPDQWFSCVEPGELTADELQRVAASVDERDMQRGRASLP